MKIKLNLGIEDNNADSVADYICDNMNCDNCPFGFINKSKDNCNETLKQMFKLFTSIKIITSDKE